MSRPPHGGRGLKLVTLLLDGGAGDCRPPHGGRGLKFLQLTLPFLLLRSSSTRGTWIEMLSSLRIAITSVVVLHTGDVD